MISFKKHEIDKAHGYRPVARIIARKEDTTTVVFQEKGDPQNAYSVSVFSEQGLVEQKRVERSKPETIVHFLFELGKHALDYQNWDYRRWWTDAQGLEVTIDSKRLQILHAYGLDSQNGLWLRALFKDNEHGEKNVLVQLRAVKEKIEISKIVPLGEWSAQNGILINDNIFLLGIGKKYKQDYDYEKNYLNRVVFLDLLNPEKIQDFVFYNSPLRLSDFFAAHLAATAFEFAETAVDRDGIKQGTLDFLDEKLKEKADSRVLDNRKMTPPVIAAHRIGETKFLVETERRECYARHMEQEEVKREQFGPVTKRITPSYYSKDGKEHIQSGPYTIDVRTGIVTPIFLPQPIVFNGDTYFGLKDYGHYLSLCVFNDKRTEIPIHSMWRNDNFFKPIGLAGNKLFIFVGYSAANMAALEFNVDELIRAKDELIIIR